MCKNSVVCRSSESTIASMLKYMSTDPKQTAARIELAMPLADASAALREQIEKGKQLCNIAIENEVMRSDARDAWRSWREYNKTLLERMFSTGAIRDEYTGSVSAFVFGTKGFADRVAELRSDIKDDVRKLESIEQRLRLYESHAPLDMSSPTRTNRVFIVHGHDETTKAVLARMLERIGLEPIILHEQPNRGRTIIEKFEHFADVGFAVIVLTPDDVGGIAGSQNEGLAPRARQNVVFEFGFFIGKLGRDKVVALMPHGIERPSDISGVIYTPLDAVGAWKLDLAKELKAAGYTINMDKIV